MSDLTRGDFIGADAVAGAVLVSGAAIAVADPAAAEWGLDVLACESGYQVLCIENLGGTRRYLVSRCPGIRISNFAFYYKFRNDLMEWALADKRFLKREGGEGETPIFEGPLLKLCDSLILVNRPSMARPGHSPVGLR